MRMYSTVQPFIISDSEAIYHQCYNHIARTLKQLLDTPVKTIITLVVHVISTIDR